MNGWKRPEVTGALGKALQNKTAEFDRLVDSEKTADLINDFFTETVKEAVQHLLIKRPKNEEEAWVIRSRAAVTKLLKQSIYEREKARKKVGVTLECGRPSAKLQAKKRLPEKIRRLSVTLCFRACCSGCADRTALSARSLHPKGATADRCVMVMCPLARSWYRGLWNKKRGKETRKRT